MVRRVLARYPSGTLATPVECWFREVERQLLSSLDAKLASSAETRASVTRVLARYPDAALSEGCRALIVSLRIAFEEELTPASSLAAEREVAAAPEQPFARVDANPRAVDAVPTMLPSQSSMDCTSRPSTPVAPRAASPLATTVDANVIGGGPEVDPIPALHQPADSPSTDFACSVTRAGGPVFPAGLDADRAAVAGVSDRGSRASLAPVVTPLREVAPASSRANERPQGEVRISDVRDRVFWTEVLTRWSADENYSSADTGAPPEPAPCHVAAAFAFTDSRPTGESTSSSRNRVGHTRRSGSGFPHPSAIVA